LPGFDSKIRGAEALPPDTLFVFDVPAEAVAAIDEPSIEQVGRAGQPF
jgi:hypothetical protein